MQEIILLLSFVLSEVDSIHTILAINRFPSNEIVYDSPYPNLLSCDKQINFWISWYTVDGYTDLKVTVNLNFNHKSCNISAFK